MPKGVYLRGPNHASRTWTDEQVAILREHAGKITANKIAPLVGHTFAAVNKKMESLGLQGCRVGNPTRTTWPAEQLAVLRQLAGTLPAREIGAMVGHTKYATQKKMHDLGLPGFADGGRPLPPSKLSRGTPEQQTQIRELAAQGLTGEEIARAIGVTGRTARTWAARLGVTLPTPKGPWTPEEDALLRENAHLGCAGAAKIVGRTDRSCDQRAGKIGVSFLAAKRAKAQPKPKRIRTPKAPKPKLAKAPKQAKPKPRRVVVEVSRISYCPTCSAPVSNREQHFERMPRCKPQPPTTRSAFPWLQPSLPARLAG